MKKVITAFLTSLLLFSFCWTENGISEIKEIKPNPGDLLFDIEAEKTFYFLYEPVFLSFRVSNPTREIIEAKFSMNPKVKFLKFFVKHPDNNEIPMVSVLTINVLASSQIIQPGETMENQVEMLFHGMRGNFSFPIPGKYLVYGKLMIPTSLEVFELQSNEVDALSGLPKSI